MLEDLNSFTALIQFMGAFNFANVYCKFHDSLSKHFFDTEETFNKQFEKSKSQITTDKESVSKMKIVKTTEGDSNEDCINDLKKDYEKLDNQHEVELNSLKSICEQHKPNFMQPMFLIIGIYSILILLITALLNVYKDNPYINLVLITFNAVTLFYVFYFPICDILKFYNIPKNQYLIIRPTLLSSFVYYIVFVFIVYICFYFNNLHFENRIVNDSFIGFISWSPVYLPFSGFLLCILLVIFYTVKVKQSVKKKSKSIVDEYKSLHERKLTLDNSYGTFKTKMQFTPEKGDVRTWSSNNYNVRRRL
jgi:hypothetical protein